MNIIAQIRSVHFNKLSHNEKIYNYVPIKISSTILDAANMAPLNQYFLPPPKVKYDPDF